MRLPLPCLRFLLLAAAAMLLLPACSSSRLWPWKKKPRATLVTHALVGTVTLVNEEGSFILIDNGSAPPPQPGTVLKGAASSALPWEAKVTAIRKPPFVIADIVKGAPKKGDQAFAQ